MNLPVQPARTKRVILAAPNHALGSVVVSSLKNFMATDDRSIQQHCSCSRRAANQEQEQMECKSPSEGGGPGGCRQLAPTT